MEISDALLQKVAAYTPSADAIASIQDVPILVVVGISGAGKDTTVGKLLADFPDEFQFMVSHTTRKQRSNNGVMEQDGREYYFIDQATFERMVDNGEYIEAQVYAGNIYGSSFAEVERAKQAGKIVVNDIEVRGVGEYVKRGIHVKPVFLLPPSFDVWWQRLTARYTDVVEKQDIRHRMETALDELQYARDNEFFYLLVNDNLGATVGQLHKMARGQADNGRTPEALHVIDELINQTTLKLASL